MTTRILHVVPSFWPATFWGGPIRSTDEVAVGDIELTTHVHADVTPGAARTGEPEPASGGLL